MPPMPPPPAVPPPDATFWFHRLADALPIIVWTATADGQFDFINSAGRQCTGHERPTDFEQAFHPEDWPALRAAWQAAVQRRQRHEGRCRVWRVRDGVWRWHSWRAVPIGETTADVRLWVGTLSDEHDVRSLVQVNQELTAAEERARRAAEEAARMKDEFLAALGHELRTPLNAIAGWTSLLKRGLGADETTRAVDVLERNVQVQRRLIDELLDASRIISGQIRLDVHPVDVTDIVARALEAIRPVADARDLHLESEIEATAPMVHGDPTRLQQVFAHLLGNAVKFTPADGHIRLRLWADGGQVHVEVRDSGGGISPSALPFVFDRLRPATPDHRRPGGFGLGLAISRQLVEMHGGRVAVDSAGSGLGTTATVTLPAAQGAYDREASPPASGLRSADDVALQLRGLSILVIEDDADSREMLSVLLENVGAVPVAAATVGEALRLLGDLEIDVVLSDIGMPGRDGFDLIRALRSFPNPRVRRAPALAVTAFSRLEDRERILSAGFDGHVAKPVEPRDLFTAVGDVVRRRQGELPATPTPPGP